MLATIPLLDFLGANPLVVWSFVLGLIVLSIVRYWRSPYRHLPPGPPGVPIWGNKSLLGKKQFKTFSTLSDTYGKHTSIRVRQS